MAQQVITANATAALSANGTSTTTGSIRWTAPSLPSGVTSWDSVRISGTWSWTGKGTVTRVTINGTNTTTGVAFNISLPITQTSPLSITCVGGNKNASGSNFTWSDLIVTYTYTTGSGDDVLIKTGSSWQSIQYEEVYKNINGQWVLQDEPSSAFDENIKYVTVNNYL